MKAFLIIVALTFGFGMSAEAARGCTGAADCKVCSNCNACKYCKAGGTCGVCKAKREAFEERKKGQPPKR